jgi:hypothetical protein
VPRHFPGDRTRPSRNKPPGEESRASVVDVEIDPETGLFIGLEDKVFRHEYEAAALRGAPCPKCGRIPTHVRPIPTSDRKVWYADPRPNCWTPGCNARNGDELDTEYYDFRVTPEEEFVIRPPDDPRPI